MTAGELWDELCRDLPPAHPSGRAEVVRRLAGNPRRREVTPSVLQAMLDRFPVARWDAETCGLYVRLLGEITPGGLLAAWKAMPDWFLVAANVPVDQPRRGGPAGRVGEGAG